MADTPILQLVSIQHDTLHAPTVNGIAFHTDFKHRRTLMGTYPQSSTLDKRRTDFVISAHRIKRIESKS